MTTKGQWYSASFERRFHISTRVFLTTHLKWITNSKWWILQSETVWGMDWEQVWDMGRRLTWCCCSCGSAPRCCTSGSSECHRPAAAPTQSSSSTVYLRKRMLWQSNSHCYMAQLIEKLLDTNGNRVAQLMCSTLLKPTQSFQESIQTDLVNALQILTSSDVPLA